MKILLTGGSGRLGTELQELGDFWVPTHEELDITKPIDTHYNFSMVIHAAAYTAVDAAESDQNKCIELNIGGTARLAHEYANRPFVYISTEHAPNSPNVYGITKYGGEEVVKAICSHYLIIRTLFKPRPWLYDNAWTDQMTLGDYTDTIAGRIIESIDEWDKVTSNLIYVGTGRKSIFDLAKQTRPDVKPSSRLDHPGKAERPADYE